METQGRCRLDSLSSSAASKPKRWQFGAIAALSVGLSGLGMMAILSPTQAQNRMPQLSQDRMLRTLTVTGQCTEKIPATIANVQLGVEAQGKTAQQVQEEVARRSTAVVALLKSRIVRKLQTTGINLSPQYNYDNGKQTLTGYQASNTVSFRVSSSDAGLIMDDAVKAGASRIDSVAFIATDEAVSDAQKGALKKATQDAQEQGKAVLEALGLSPKEIVGIQLNGSNVPPPVPYNAPQGSLVKTAAADAATPVEAGEQSVEASVTLQISY